MDWRFTLYNRAGAGTVIDEPTGWDGIKIVLPRDPERHGILFSFSNNDFEFDGIAYKMIRAEHEQYLSDGVMSLKIEWSCKGVYEELYTGRLLFLQPKFSVGNGCSVKIPIETTSDVMTLNNKWDQIVDLLTEKSFDGTTDLVPYSALPKVISLPSKKILLQCQQFAKDHEEFDITADSDWNTPVGSTHASAQWKYAPSLIDIRLNELVGFEPYIVDDVLTNPPLDQNARIFHYEETTVLNYTNFEYRLRFKGTFKDFGSADRGYDVRLRVRHRDATGFFTVIHLGFIHSFSGIGNNTITFDQTFTNTITLLKGEGLYFDVFINCVKFTTGTHVMSMIWDDETEIFIKADSEFPATDAKLFLIHEAFNRTAEAITNDRMRVYSEYFGRTDSEPYAYAADGLGSLEALTKGLFIRRMDSDPAKPPVMGVSMKSLWEGVNPIHNIGMGIEPDPDRAGLQRLRIEPANHFYNDSVIMRCTDVNKIDFEVSAKDIFSTFEFGFSKWEAEEFNGLDEILTKRIYRSVINSTQNPLSRISTFIASGYAIEVTRRQSTTSKDWRYDNDVFIVCLKRVDPDLLVDLGNITNAANIYDPASLYNYRISPVRNALRWLKKVLASYAFNTSDSKIVFTDGTGNYHGEGELLDPFGKQENGVLTEKQELSTDNLTTEADGVPLTAAKRVRYNYPMSVKEFKTIAANPYGVIEYSTIGYEGAGWIDTISYEAESGIASFILIPKYSL